jgi:hypothetical protein
MMVQVWKWGISIFEEYDKVLKGMRIIFGSEDFILHLEGCGTDGLGQLGPASLFELRRMGCLILHRLFSFAG